MKVAPQRMMLIKIIYVLNNQKLNAALVEQSSHNSLNEIRTVLLHLVVKI